MEEGSAVHQMQSMSHLGNLKCSGRQILKRGTGEVNFSNVPYLIQYVQIMIISTCHPYKKADEAVLHSS